MNPKISVIVIIYRVGKFLPKCLESIAAQTCDDIEVICVVGKGDTLCEEISREYERKDPRFRVIVSEPRGTANARNTGLKYSSGEYIAFVDGDDFIEPDMLETMLKGAVRYQADISVVGKFYAYENCTEDDNAMNGHSFGKRADEAGTELLCTEDALKTVLYGTGFFLHIWDKLYRRELFDDIRFDEGKKVEDREISYRLLIKAKRMVYDRSPKYYFRDSSDSGSRVEDNLARSYEANEAICADIVKRFPSLSEACEVFLACEAMSVIQNSMLYGSFSAAHDGKYLDIVRAKAGTLLKNGFVSRPVKLKAVLCLFCPGMLKRLTLSRRKSFLKSHRQFCAGNDWQEIFKGQGIE